MLTLKDYCTLNQISYTSATQAFHRGDIPGFAIIEGRLCVPDDCTWQPTRRGRPTANVPRTELQRIWQFQQKHYGKGYSLPEATIEKMVTVGEKYRLNQVCPSLIEVCFKVFQSLTVEQLEDPALNFAQDEVLRQWSELSNGLTPVEGAGLGRWLGLFFDWATKVGSMAVRRYRKQSIATYNRILAEHRVQMFAAQL